MQAIYHKRLPAKLVVRIRRAPVGGGRVAPSLPTAAAAASSPAASPPQPQHVVQQDATEVRREHDVDAEVGGRVEHGQVVGELLDVVIRPAAAEQRHAAVAAVAAVADGEQQALKQRRRLTDDEYDDDDDQDHRHAVVARLQ